MNISPGLIGLYWLAASFVATVLIARAAHVCKRAGHNARARCYCGTCQR